MARTAATCVRFVAVVAALLATQTRAQQCYYPNGNKAPDTEKPCSSAKGAACCPDTWECLDNGLCHLPTDDLYGRYSCTDKNWDAPGCPSNMCTYGMKAAGGESIVHCSNHNNQWCCNADATHVRCCQESPQPRPFFRLQDGQAYAVIGQSQASDQPALASITGLATGSGMGPPIPRPSAPSMPGGFPQAVSVSSVRPLTSEVTSVSSGTAGIQTVVQTVLFTPSSSAISDNLPVSDGSNSHIGVIVGCAVGIPLALVLAGIILWMLRKRRQQKANPYNEKAEGDSQLKSESPDFAAAVAAKLGKKELYRRSRPGTTEIDGAPAGPSRPVSSLPGHAELESGTGFEPGHNAYSPNTVGIGGGNVDARSTWGSAPPGYSPGVNQVAFHHAEVSELDGTSVMPAISEKPEEPQQYQAYRPPQQASVAAAEEQAPEAMSENSNRPAEKE